MMNCNRLARLFGRASFPGVWLIACAIVFAPQCCSADIFADSFDDWSSSGTQGENGWYNGWRNYSADGGGAYDANLNFIPFVNDGSGDPVSQTGNQWTGSDYAMAVSAAPWTRLGQEFTHPASPQPPGTTEEHWTIRRWESTVSGLVTLQTHLRADNTGGTGTTNELYVNGTLLDTYTTNSSTGITSYFQTTLNVGDLVDLAFTPVGAGGDRGDGADGSYNRLTVTNEPPPVAPIFLADSVDDWSASGTQGENGWTHGYYNLTTDPDETYQASDFIPFPNDGGPHSATNFWNGDAWDWFDGNPPWTFLGQEDVHPNGTNNINEHWVIRRWEADVTETTPVALKWQTRKTNPNNDGVTGMLMVNGVQVDSATIAGNDAAGVNNTFYVNLQPGDVIDLALSPQGLTNREDGSDGSATRLTIDAGLPAGPLFNPTGNVVADSVAEFSGVQGQDGWTYGYYDQRADVENSDGVYGTADFTEFPDDDGPGTSADDFWADTRWDWHAGNPPWTELTNVGGHPAANAPLHWAVRRWTNDEVDGDVRIAGLLHNGSGSGDGTIGRILVNGVEVFSEVSNGNQVPFSVDLEIALGDTIDFAIDPDGAGVFDLLDPSTLDAVNDGSDGSTFLFTIEEVARFTPVPEPTSVSLFLAALFSLAVCMWRRRR